ncbi:MAG: SH3 domain-containing protein [Nostocaceae cyanobacterium]|nr:SH3 domain-containing protein [Nostocaceae cyanobacterium]
MFKILLAGALILSSAALPASAENSRSLSVCTHDSDGSLTLRRGPGKDYEEMRQIPSKKVIQELDSRHSEDGFQWSKVSYKGTTGWVRSDYLCNIPSID